MDKTLRILIQCLVLLIILSGFDIVLSEAGPGRYDVPVFWENTEKTGAVIRFSRGSGICSEEDRIITISAPEGYTVAFTTNGTVPSAGNDSGLAAVSIDLSQTAASYIFEHTDLMIFPDFPGLNYGNGTDLPAGTIINASLVDENGMLSSSSAQVYFFDIDFSESFPECLVLSIITDPVNLLDYHTGLLVTGSAYDEWRVTDEGRRIIDEMTYWFAETNSTRQGKAWERPCTIQIYDNKKEPTVEINAGIRIQGGMSRRLNQKSFNVYFRSEYGSKQLNYPLFEGTDAYRSFTLRNGGNGADFLKYREALFQTLLSGRHFTTMRSRPAVLFINGEYFGPYFLTEKLSDQMIHDLFGVDKDQVVIIKDEEVEEGEDEDIQLYREFLSFAERDLTDPDIYRQFSDCMDIQSMIDFFAARIYLGNHDWKTDSNMVFWRTRDDSYNNGRWQFILYDTDYSAGMYDETATSEKTNHFRDALDKFPVFAAAMRNEVFYDQFLETIKEIGSENLSFQRVRAFVNLFSGIWEPLMPDYYKRYGDRSKQWDSDMDHLMRFFRYRYNYIIQFAEEYH